MTRKDFMCGACKRAFSSEAAVRDHIRDGHRKGGNVAIYHKIDVVRGADHNDGPSMAELAVQAEIDRAMGVANDDDWLLP